VTAPEVHGSVAPGFEAVRAVFAEHAADVGLGGAAYAAVHDGHVVVDLWAGSARPGVDWDERTLPVWMSVTKALTTACVALLVDRGVLSVEDRVSRWWPEFGAAGKDEITVADVLTHVSGVIGSPDLTDLVDARTGVGLDRTDEVLALVADAKPAWEPGTAAGYHTVTFGWVLGEVVRRADGRDLGTFFREEVALPLGLDDLWLGTPPRHLDRVAQTHPLFWHPALPETGRAYLEGMLADARDERTPAGLSCFARDGVGLLDRLHVAFNRPEGLIPPLGGSNLCGRAADVARVFGALATPGALLSEGTTRLFTTVHETRPDVVLHLPISRGLGFWRNVPLVERPRGFGPHDEAFGHTGMGGQIGFADPVSRVGVGFVRSHHTSFPYLPLLLNAALYDVLP
jgi:CubicO group peptidase (beta-lactamase class C family)